MTKTRTELSWTAVRPSEEAIRTRAEKFAEKVGGAVDYISAISVSTTRHRTPRFSVTVEIVKQTN